MRRNVNKVAHSHNIAFDVNCGHSSKLNAFHTQQFSTTSVSYFDWTGMILSDASRWRRMREVTYILLKRQYLSRRHVTTHHCLKLQFSMFMEERVNVLQMMEILRPAHRVSFSFTAVTDLTPRRFWGNTPK